MAAKIIQFSDSRLFSLGVCKIKGLQSRGGYMAEILSFMLVDPVYAIVVRTEQSGDCTTILDNNLCRIS